MSRLEEAAARKEARDVAEARREQIRQDVALMRELGILRWGDLILGPERVAPGDAKELTPEEVQERIAARAKAQHDTLFAASGTRPRLPGELPTRTVLPMRNKAGQ